MPLVGGNSGFKTTRDLLLFIIGAAGLGYALITSKGMVNLELLVFFGGLMGAPYILNKDEAAKPSTQE